MIFEKQLKKPSNISRYKHQTFSLKKLSDQDHFILDEESFEKNDLCLTRASTKCDTKELVEHKGSQEEAVCSMIGITSLPSQQIVKDYQNPNPSYFSKEHRRAAKMRNDCEGVVPFDLLAKGNLPLLDENNPKIKNSNADSDSECSGVEISLTDSSGSFSSNHRTLGKKKVITLWPNIKLVKGNIDLEEPASSSLCFSFEYIQEEVPKKVGVEGNSSLLFSLEAIAHQGGRSCHSVNMSIRPGVWRGSSPSKKTSETKNILHRKFQYRRNCSKLYSLTEFTGKSLLKLQARSAQNQKRSSLSCDL